MTDADDGPEPGAPDDPNRHEVWLRQAKGHGVPLPVEAAYNAHLTASTWVDVMVDAGWRRVQAGPDALLDHGGVFDPTGTAPGGTHAAVGYLDPDKLSFVLCTFTEGDLHLASYNNKKYLLQALRVWTADMREMSRRANAD